MNRKNFLQIFFALGLVIGGYFLETKTYNSRMNDDIAQLINSLEKNGMNPLQLEAVQGFLKLQKATISSFITGLSFVLFLGSAILFTQFRKRL